MSKYLKTCSGCNNFYKVDSPQFLINLVLSEKLKDDQKNKEVYEKIQEEINEVSGIKWCLCETSIEDKKTHIGEYENRIKTQEESKINLGFDFTLNKNIIYYKEKGENVFDKIAFISFVKELKTNIKNHNLDFNFDYINCAKLVEMDKKELRKYMTDYKYLLFFNLSSYNDSGAQGLKLFNELITERLVNGKKSFIMCETHGTLGQLLKEIENNLFKNQKHIIEETRELLATSNGFQQRRISAVIDKKGRSVLNTSSVRGKQEKPKQKVKKDTPNQKIDF